MKPVLRLLLSIFLSIHLATSTTAAAFVDVPEMTVGQKQELFSRLLPLLIIKAHELGYEVRLRGLWRTPEQVEWNAAAGVGIKNSLHCLGLAIDLVLTENEEPFWAAERYVELGEYWESLSELTAWGGRFDDAGHFSIQHKGRR